MVAKIIFGSIIGLLVGVGTVADMRDQYKLKVGATFGVIGCLVVYLPVMFILS